MKDSIEKFRGLTEFSSDVLVDDFLVQFRKDYLPVISSAENVLVLADNMLNAISEVFTQTNQINEMDQILKRLELLDEYLLKKRSNLAADEYALSRQLGQDASCVTELWQAIKTVREELHNRIYVEDLARHCEECESHLRKIILNEANKLPNGGIQYCVGEGSHLKNLDEINVDALSADLYKNEGSFASGGVYHKRASRELIEAVRSYEATKRLHKTLKNAPDVVSQNKFKSSDNKLKLFKEEYDKEVTKKDLQANPDPKVKTFFKVVGYVLANIFTGGALHFATKGSFLMSKPQKLGKRAKEVVEEVNNPKKRKR